MIGNDWTSSSFDQELYVYIQFKRVLVSARETFCYGKIGDANDDSFVEMNMIQR